VDTPAGQETGVERGDILRVQFAKGKFAETLMVKQSIKPMRKYLN